MSNEQLAPALPIRRIGGLGFAVTVLVGAVVVLDMVSTWTTWYAYGVFRDYVAGQAGDTDLISADDIVSTVSWWYVVAFVAAGIFFMTWLWRARMNAERLVPAPHRRGRGWIIGGWICPVVNLWFPFMIVDDVYRASRPGNPPLLTDLRSVPGGHLLGPWWALWLGSLLLGRIVNNIWDNADSPDSLRTAGLVELVESAATLGAAAAVILIVRQISTWQDARAGQTA